MIAAVDDSVTARSRTSGEKSFDAFLVNAPPLKLWSLRQTRGGSYRDPATRAQEPAQRIGSRVLNPGGFGAKCGGLDMPSINAPLL
jgi:hypothetical protein